MHLDKKNLAYLLPDFYDCVGLLGLSEGVHFPECPSSCMCNMTCM